jgi:hypothetical protein
MNQQPQLDTFEIPNRSPEEFKRYQNLITTAVSWAHEHKGAPNFFPDDEAGHVICVSWLISDPKLWEERFRDSQNKAGFFYRDWNTYRNTIALGVSTPEVKSACLESFPNLDWEKYFKHSSSTPAPQRIAPQTTPAVKRKHPHKKGELWKLDARWDHLWPSSRKVFPEILRRTQYQKRPGNFPWSQTGVKSLVKFTGVSECQVRRALHQLECFGLIKRIVKGNTFEGASKYLVFITPSMSGVFKIKSLSSKKRQPFKKPISTMS